MAGTFQVCTSKTCLVRRTCGNLSSNPHTGRVDLSEGRERPTQCPWYSDSAKGLIRLVLKADEPVIDSGE